MLTISNIIREARGVFEELRKHGYEVVSIDSMESIIGRISVAANNNQTCINCVAVEKAFAMHAKAAELHEMNYTTQKEVER